MLFQPANIEPTSTTTTLPLAGKTKDLSEKLARPVLGRAEMLSFVGRGRERDRDVSTRRLYKLCWPLGNCIISSSPVKAATQQPAALCGRVQDSKLKRESAFCRFVCGTKAESVHSPQKDYTTRTTTTKQTSEKQKHKKTINNNKKYGKQ